jgi:copper transport protein
VTRRALLVAALGLVWASTARAHAVPLATSPADGSALASAPTVVEVTFDSPVEVGPRNAAIRNDGVSVLAGVPVLVESRRLVLPLPRGLADGNYTARWSVVSDDGHEQEGITAFGIGTTAGPPVAALTIRGYESWQRVVMRTSFFLGLLGAAGLAFYCLAVLTPLGLETTLVRRHSHVLFAFFLLAFAGADALSHTTGAGGTRFERFMITAAVSAGIGAAAAALTPLLPRLRYAGWACAAVLLVCPTFAGHALDRSQPSFVAAAADLLHLAGAAMWVGGLAGLVWLSGPSRADAARRFSGFAVTAVVLVAAGGVSRAVTELSSIGQLWSTSYGRALLVKSALFAALLALAWLARRRPALLLAELVLLTGVVVAVGTLTDLRPGRERAARAGAAEASLSHLRTPRCSCRSSSRASTARRRARRPRGSSAPRARRPRGSRAHPRTRQGRQVRREAYATGCATGARWRSCRRRPRCRRAQTSAAGCGADAASGRP